MFVLVKFSNQNTVESIDVESFAISKSGLIRFANTEKNFFKTKNQEKQIVKDEKQNLKVKIDMVVERGLTFVEK